MLTGNVELPTIIQLWPIPKACIDGLIVRQAAIAGGLGACYAPNGERDGYPLGVKPARIQAAM